MWYSIMRGRMTRAAALLLLLLLSPMSLFAEDTVVARVNGVAITSGQLEEGIDQIMPRGMFHGAVSEDRREEFREKALEALITMELQYQDAIKRGLKPDKKIVKQQMKKVRDTFRSEWEYNIWLEKMRLDEDRLKQRIEKAVVVRSAFSQLVEEPAQLNEKVLQEYYDKNLEAFRQGESVKLRIISTKSEQNAKAAAEALNGGADFASVASRLSEDNFKDKGGDVGEIQRGKVYPKLEETAFAMQKGETSAPIFTENLWFLIKVEDKRPARIAPFTDVREKLKQDLEAKKRNELLEKWIAELRAKAEIVVLPQFKEDAAQVSK